MKWEKIMKTKLETPESVTPRALMALKPPAVSAVSKWRQILNIQF